MKGISVQAILDTAVDFSDEYSAVVEQAKHAVEAVILGCSRIVERYSAFKTGGTQPRLVLAGRPNAGKSSLFNALLCRYRAIVHEEPGTTRDVIEEDIEVDGARWKLVDTAGIRESSGAEREGIALGEDYLSASAFWLLVVDGTEGMSDVEERLLGELAHVPHLVLWNKNDLPNWKSPGPLENVISVSVKNGDSVTALWQILKERLIRADTRDSGPLPTSVQVSRLVSVLGNLEEMRNQCAAGTPPELLAEMNRSALRGLEGIVGEIGTEDVLDRIFSDFCIGK